MVGSGELTKYVTLSNGVTMPRVGFGTWQLRDNDAKRSTLHALKSGYELIDTASVYGNESMIKEALLSYKKLGNTNKNIQTGNEYGIFITSKASKSEISSGNVYKACHDSLERLGIQTIDLYLLHWPGADGSPDSSDAHRQNRVKAWKDMEKLYNEKKVRSIGVSNYLPKHLNELVEDGITIMPMVDQVEYHPMCQNVELLRWASNNKMQMQSYSSLGVGNATLLNHPVVIGISKEINKTPAQVLLRWSLQQGLCVIPRSQNEGRIEENQKIVDYVLNDNHIKTLSGINTNTHFCWDPNLVA